MFRGSYFPPKRKGVFKGTIVVPCRETAGFLKELFMAKARKILVVEDEREVRDFLNDAFVEEGYDVVSVPNAEEALVALDSEIQVMFLDLKLPGEMNGLELCRKIRKDYPTACIYAMTGHSTLFELADCRAVGFDDYFTKPIRLETLYMAAEQAFDRIDRWGNK